MTTEQTNNAEILTDEQLELEQEIASYESKIAELDGRLAEHKSKYIGDKKAEAMKKAGYSAEQIERYIGHISDENIEQSVRDLSFDIPPIADNYADPNPFNGAKTRTNSRNKAETIAKDIFNRLKGANKL